MIICVDMDSVLNDLMPKTLSLYNSRTGKNIQISDLVTYDFYECLLREDADGIIESFKEKRLWDSLTPLSGSQKTLKTLTNQGYHIIVATATDPCNFEWKCQWMAKYFPFIPTDNIIRITNKSLIKCDIMLDDYLDNLTSNMCHRVCFDYPWNRDKNADFVYDIIRVKGWNDIANIIKDIERKEKEWEKE